MMNKGFSYTSGHLREGMTTSVICRRCTSKFEYVYRGGDGKRYCPECRKILDREQKGCRRRGKLGQKVRKKRHRERSRKELRSGYIRQQIRDRTGLPARDVPLELVEEKRKQLYALRLYRRARKEIER